MLISVCRWFVIVLYFSLYFIVIIITLALLICIYIKIWFSFLVDYEYYNECVNVFQWFLFLFSTLHFQLRNYLLTYFTRSRTFVFSLHDWSHLYSLNTFSLFSHHRLHYVNWLALLFPSENSFWCMSFVGNSYNNDDEKYRMKRNITIPDLCQQSNNNVIVYIHTHLISLSFTSSILSFIFFFSRYYIHSHLYCILNVCRWEWRIYSQVNNKSVHF